MLVSCSREERRDKDPMLDKKKFKMLWKEKIVVGLWLMLE